MNRTPTYKAVAYEHSYGDTDYHLGEGVAFSNSIKHAIEEAKEKAFQHLMANERKAGEAGVPHFAHLHVFKNNKEVINASY
jgi:ribosomal protein S5|tara:strand:- start:493 stop:735 length:243 start_codon:yes stop_codon:yes gene_type:complete